MGKEWVFQTRGPMFDSRVRFPANHGVVVSGRAEVSHTVSQGIKTIYEHENQHSIVYNAMSKKQCNVSSTVECSRVVSSLTMKTQLPEYQLIPFLIAICVLGRAHISNLIQGILIIQQYYIIQISIASSPTLSTTTTQNIWVLYSIRYTHTRSRSDLL